MKAMDLLVGFGSVKDSYVISAREFRQGKQKAQIKRLSTRKIWLIAAVIALTLLLVGCAVVYVLSLHDMKIGEYSVTKPEHYGPNWEVIGAKEKTFEVLSVQGYSDSPNQQAVKEFRDYIDSTGGDNITNTEKMQEIAQKYGLKMLSDGIDVSYNQGYVLLESLHLPGVCKSKPYAEIKYQGGIFHPEGTFDIIVDIEPDNELLKWPYTIHADFQYYQKGYFKYYYICVENLDSFQEWIYTMPDGETALLALGEDDALIIAERKNGTFCVHFDPHVGIFTMTKETMEMVADLFDFSIVPHTLSPDEWQSAKNEIQRLDALEHQEWLKMEAQWKDSLKKGDFSAWVRQALEGRTYEEVNDLGFAFYDIDGNGVDDLLIGRDGYCLAIYWEVDGETEQFADAAAILFPCENQTVGYVLVPWGTNYFFTHADNGTTNGVANLKYVPGHPEGEYQKGDMESWNKYEVITKEEFESIMNSFVRVPITFLPLTEYPLNEKVQFSEGNGNYVEEFNNYEEKILLRLTSPEEQWPRWKYNIQDLNDDGIDELIWSEDGRVTIYTMVDGGVRSYRMVSDGSIAPCQNGIIEAVQHYGPVNKTYRYYQLKGDQAELIEYLRYDVDKSPDNPWFRSPDLTGQDITLEPISEKEAISIIASYEHLEITMKPVSEYPFE